MTIINVTLVDGTVLPTHYLRVGTLGDIHTDTTILCPSNIKSVEVSWSIREGKEFDAGNHLSPDFKC